MKLLGCAVLLCGLGAAAQAEMVGVQPAAANENTVLLMPFDGKTVDEALRVVRPEGGSLGKKRGPFKPVAGRFDGAVELGPSAYFRINVADIIDPKAFRIGLWVKMDPKKAEGGSPFGLNIVFPSKEKRSGYVRLTTGRYRHGGKLFRDWQLTCWQDGDKVKRRYAQYSIEHWKPEWRHVGVTWQAGAKPRQGVTKYFIDGLCVGVMDSCGDLNKASLMTISGGNKGCAIDDLVICRGAKPFTAAEVGWEGFLPGQGLKRCRINLPVYVYFSQPMDPKFTGVTLFDETANAPIQASAKVVGDGSVLKLDFSDKKPLPLGRRIAIRFPSDPEKQLRSIDGACFDPSKSGQQWFATRAKNQPPRPLNILIRNNNLQTDLKGTEQALRNGLDIVEVNPVKLKDAWISNHSVRRGRGKPRTLGPGPGGDRKGFMAVPTAPHETLYETYARLDYVNVKDGKIDPIPHFEDQMRIINRWDRLIALQGYGPGTVEEYKALYKRCGWRWNRVVCYHGPPNPCYAKPGLTWHQWRGMAGAENWLIGNGIKVRGSLFDNNPLFPNGITPRMMAEAKRKGKMTWTYASMRLNIVHAARLGIDVAPPNNRLAYRRDLRARQRLYELNDYEGARPPEVAALTCSGKPLHGRKDVKVEPTFILDFSVPAEARSVNYDSVRLVALRGPQAADDKDRVPMFIRTDKDQLRFTLNPQVPLKPGGSYRLTVGFGKYPKAASGKAMRKPFQVTFATGG